MKIKYGLKIKRIITIALLASFLASCSSYRTTSVDAIDPNCATIVIPMKLLGFNAHIGKIYRAFQEANWKVYGVCGYEFCGPAGMTCVRACNDAFIQHQARYEFTYCWRTISSPFIAPFSCYDSMRYTVSIIDHATGLPVFTMEGQSCGSGIVERIQRWLCAHPGAFY